MYTNTIYKRALRMACITSPLFGLFGTAPVFEIGTFDMQRITTGFFIITFLTFIVWLINIGLLWVSNRFDLDGKNWLRYILSAALCIPVFLLANRLIPVIQPELPAEIIKNLPLKHFPKPFGILMPLIQTMSINLVIIVSVEMMLLQDKKHSIEKENSRLRMFNLEAKHSQLKQQLHPHFLFNSLTTLRSLIKRSPPKAEQYLIKLAELLRFSINSTGQALVTLEEEIEFTCNYLHMQQVRFLNALNFTIEIPAEMGSSTRVPAYSIQLLVENAIKHNILTTARPLVISIKADDNSRSVSIGNNLQPKPFVEQESGVGLSNLADRYRLLNNEEISIERTVDEFIVTIKVLENDNNYN